MARTPTPAARARCIELLRSLAEDPPDGCLGVAIDSLDGGQHKVASVPIDQIQGDDCEDLFDLHVDRHGQAGGRYQYRVLLESAEGRPRSGTKRSWGLRSGSTAARDARTAGGGAEVAASAVGQELAGTQRALLGQFGDLVEQAAGTNRLSLETARDDHERALESQLWWMDQNSTLREELVITKMELRLAEEQREPFMTTDAGQALLLSVVQSVVPAIATLLAALVEGRQLDNLERRVALGASHPPRPPDEEPDPKADRRDDHQPV